MAEQLPSDQRRADFIAYVSKMRDELGCKPVSDSVLSQAFDIMERCWPPRRPDTEGHQS